MTVSASRDEQNPSNIKVQIMYSRDEQNPSNIKVQIMYGPMTAYVVEDQSHIANFHEQLGRLLSESEG